MAVALGRRLLSIDEFERDYYDSRYELIRGELKEMSPAGAEHGKGAIHISAFITCFVIVNKLGTCFGAETGFVVRKETDSLLAPDWAFISTERMPDEPSPKFSRIIPDAILEVRSPSDRPREVREKMERWMQAGVRIGWEYDPSTKTMTVHRPGLECVTVGLDGVVSGEDVIPGFEMSLRDMLGN